MKTILTTTLTLALVLASSLPAVRAAAPPSASEPPAPPVAPPEPVNGPGGSDTLTRTGYITAYHPADINQDCQIDVADVQTVASAWRCADTDGCYDPDYDFDDDGAVSVVDIMRVAAGWGWSCGSGAGPQGAGSSTAAFLPPWALTTTQPALVTIEPLTSTVQPGEPFTVSIVISDVLNLGAFQFALGYGPTVVHVSDATLGAFPSSTGRNVSPLGPNIDNETGTMGFGAFSFGTQPGPSGYGMLCTVKFTAQGIGNTPLDLDQVQVLHPSGEPHDVLVEDGSVRVVGTQVVYLPLVVRFD